MNKVILEAKHIVKSFDGVPALKDGNLLCRAGKITGLLGPNGSGKTTMSKCIAGVLKRDSGQQIYLGKEVNFDHPLIAKKAGISMAFQNLSLIPDLTVWENIVLGFEQTKKRNGIILNNEDAKVRSKEILDYFDESFSLERKIYELDPAQLQIVEIAKAISQNPKLLILDEPTAALDRSQVNILFDYMRHLASQGVGMIFTSHRMWEVMDICDDVTVFRNGAVVGSVDFETEAKDEEKVIQMITGGGFSQTKRKSYGKIDSRKILSIQNLSYRNKLHNINLDIHKGEVLGIGGLNGQGQEELLLAIAGNYSDIDTPITINDQSFIPNAPHKAIDRGILLVPGDRQKEGLMMAKSIFENYILPQTARSTEPFIIPKQNYLHECEKAADILSIKSNGLNSLVSNLSGGNAQKVVLAKWLYFNKSLLILSDPAKGVDIGAKQDMYDLLQKLVNDEGLSVILYASDNEELMANCDRVLVMHEGEIVGELVHEEITDKAILNLSLMGTHAMRRDQ